MTSSLQSMLSGLINLKNIGNYPAGYDRAKHGQYDPSRYYGKPDTPFSEVKLGELGAWYSRRDKGFKQFAALISRGYWRWQLKYVHPRKSTFAPYLQVAVAASIFFYALNYLRLRGHRHYKYH